MNYNLNGEASLLDRVKRRVLIRRKFHSAFLITSIIALCIFMYIEVPELGFFGTLGNMFTITGLIKIATNLIAKPILSIIAVVIPFIITIVFLVIVRVLRKKMNLAFSEFWCTNLQHLPQPQQSQTPPITMDNPDDIKDKDEQEEKKK